MYLCAVENKVATHPHSNRIDTYFFLYLEDTSSVKLECLVIRNVSNKPKTVHNKIYSKECNMHQVFVQ